MNNNNFSIVSLILSLSLGLIVFLCYCNPVDQSMAPKNLKSTVKLIITGDTEIESLVFKKFGGFTEKDFKPFKDIVIVELDEEVNDFYQLSLKRGDNFIISQFWLKGQDIEIRGAIENDEFQIDTIINSPLFYYSTNTIQEYKKLLEQPFGEDKANFYMIQAIKDNIDSPFSNELASEYIRENINEINNLNVLQELIANQNQQIKEHRLSIHKTLDKLINNTTIAFKEFVFNDSRGQKSKIITRQDTLYLIDYWFTECPPCIMDHKILKSKIDSLYESRIKVIGISVDYNERKWMDFLNDRKYEWDNFIEIEEENISLSEYLGILSYPTYIIVSGNGKILNRSGSIENSIGFLKTSNLMYY